MKISPELVTTAEVATWHGVHLLHYHLSSCSQKVRILLGELGVDFESHHVDLRKDEQKSAWYRGINPNGVVPTLVHDGEVHVESNDIIAYLDDHFAKPASSLMPSEPGARAMLDDLLNLEDELHGELRAVTFTYLAPSMHGERPVEREARMAVIERLDNALNLLSVRLADNTYLLGAGLSLADIAWFITVHRLKLAGYPVQEYTGLERYYERLSERPAFRAQVNAGPLALRAAGAVYRRFNRAFLRSLPRDYQRWQAARAA